MILRLTTGRGDILTLDRVRVRSHAVRMKANSVPTNDRTACAEESARTSVDAGGDKKTISWGRW